MGIVIQNPDIEQTAKKIAAMNGISVEEAIAIALEEKYGRDNNASPDEIIGYNKHGVFDEETLAERKASYERAKVIVEAIRALPVYDSRSADEILGYNKSGTLE
jgi:hypothetical protein